MHEYDSHVYLVSHILALTFIQDCCEGQSLKSGICGCTIRRSVPDAIIPRGSPQKVVGFVVEFVYSKSLGEQRPLQQLAHLAAASERFKELWG